MRKYALGAALVALIFSGGLFSGHFRAFGQAAEPADPIFGTWKMDLARSVRNRDGKSTPFAEQATRVLAPEGDGLSMSVTNGPNGKPSAYSGKFDGKDYPDPRAPGQDRTLAHWRVTPSMIVRLQKTKGVPSEWVVYTVSPDGSILTANSWIPDKPQFVETQVYTRAR